MSPPPTALANVARAATSTSTASTPTSTCNHEGIIDLAQMEGLDQKRSAWAIPNWPESLAGMKACCPNNEVHIAGPDGCALWCYLPEEYLFEQNKDGTNGKRRDNLVVADAMHRCVKDSGNVTGTYITIWQVKEGAAAWSSGEMPSLKAVVGTVAWGMVVVGLLA